MDIAIITGSGGLIGSEAVNFFTQKGFKVVGIDNDMRSYFFGETASTALNVKRLKETSSEYEHRNVDIRDFDILEHIFQTYNQDIKIVIHTAAQPSHDWAAKEPLTDFAINATGTLNLLELTRLHSPDAVFVFTSTNKVYGDRPNGLPLEEREERYDLPEHHPLFDGIDETMSVDQSKHSLFGASKVAADVLVQEYGRYFGMSTVCFRGGCLTGPGHAGAQMHGFLSYLMRCVVTHENYTICGYKGKQVRDNIHSYDLVSAMYAFYCNPRLGEVYNVGGERSRSCSVLEAIALCESIAGYRLAYDVSDTPRSGDHIWYITDMKKFREHYPQWQQKYSLEEILSQIFVNNKDKWIDGGRQKK